MLWFVLTVLAGPPSLTADGEAPAAGDCDDSDAAIHPRSRSWGCRGVDFTCDGIPDEPDLDRDGVSGCVDCDDGDPAVGTCDTGNTRDTDAAGCIVVAGTTICDAEDAKAAAASCSTAAGRWHLALWAGLTILVTRSRNRGR